MINKNFKNLILILLMVILVTTVSGCIKKPLTDSNQEPANQQPIDTELRDAVDTEEIDTSDWKTYTNEEYGFSFRYPGEWHIVKNHDENSNLILLSSAPNFYSLPIDDALQESRVFVRVLKRPEIPLKNWLDKIKKENSIRIEYFLDIEVDNISGFEVKTHNITDEIIFYLPIDKNLLEINFATGIKTWNIYEPLFDELIRTFKFINNKNNL